jgi:hypothetical protein
MVDVGKVTSYSSVIGIDFGTGGFAIAMGFARRGPTGSIYIMEHSTATGVFRKNSVALLTHDGEDGLELVDMGKDAISKYAELDGLSKSEHYLFKSVKMALYDHSDEKMSVPEVTSAGGGRSVPAAELITMAMVNIRELAMERLQKASGTRSDLTIQWVVTVPAIWPESAKQIMRRAACDAGIPNEHLKLAMEPEVASLTCRMASEHKQFIENHTYMVVDAGTGTVDVSVHTVDENGRLQDVVAPSGLPYGSRIIDQAFVNLLCRVFSPDLVDEFQVHYPSEWITLMSKFETLKCRSDLDQLDGKKLVNIELGNKFAFFCTSDMPNDPLPDGIQFDARYSYLMLPMDIVKSLFSESVNKISNHVQSILNRPEVGNRCAIIYLVGGFGECPFLELALQQLIVDNPQWKVQLRRPIDPAMAVVRGAVLYGLYPELISLVIAQSTIGVAVTVPKSERIVTIGGSSVKANGIVNSTDALDTFVRAGQRIRPGHSVTRSYLPMSADQPVALVRLYGSPNPDCKTITEPGVRQVGEMIITLPDPERNVSREVAMTLEFGSSEIHAKAVAVADGVAAECTINFCDTEWISATPRQRFVTVDVCFAMDCTGSMQQWIDAAKDQILTMADSIRANLNSRDDTCILRFAFVAYRDFCDVNRIESVDFTTDLGKVKSFIQSQKASGGGDHPEDLLGGLNRALTLKWNAENRFIVLCADAPCHGTRFSGVNSGDDYPGGNPDGLTSEVLLRQIIDLRARMIFTRICQHTDRMISEFRLLHPSIVEIDLGTNHDCISQFGESLSREIVGHIQPKPVLF